jgi:uncharacterized membrane protein HdeD (DUF308 family)
MHASSRDGRPVGSTTRKRDVLAVLAILVGVLAATPPTVAGVALGVPLVAVGLASLGGSVRAGRVRPGGHDAGGE